MKFRSLMLDLETLATTPDAAVTQIGVCAFDLGTLSWKAPHTINIQPHPEAKIDFSTVSWWMRQSEEARTSVFSGARHDTALGVELLDQIILGYVHDGVWGSLNSVWAMPPSFDIVILEGLYRRVGAKPPWSYDSARCLRTLCDIAGIRKEDRAKPTTAHDAGADAEAQARTAIKAAMRLSSMHGEHSWVECVLPDHVYQMRIVESIERSTDSSPSLSMPLLNPGEKVEWVVGDHRPHIFRLSSKVLQKRGAADMGVGGDDRGD